MLALRSPASLCSSTPRSSAYVGVGPPVSVSTATMTGSKPTAQRNGFIGPPMPMPVFSRRRCARPSGV
eukprot:13965544-Alexandrium_andersonii.AAC.1